MIKHLIGYNMVWVSAGRKFPRWENLTMLQHNKFANWLEETNQDTGQMEQKYNPEIVSKYPVLAERWLGVILK